MPFFQMKSIPIPGILLLAASLLAANSCHAQPTVVSSDKNEDWTGTWGTAPQLTEPRNLPPPPGLTNNTLRQVVQVSIGGKKLRVYFSNAFGNGPITMNAVHVALSGGGSTIKTKSDKALMFQGKASVTIPPGKSILSDAFDFDLAPLSDLAVTIHFDGMPGDVTGHPGSRTTSYLQAGDQVSAANLPAATQVQHWYVINDIEVETGNSNAAVVALGDSITDGRGSGTDKNDRWPDNLARRLQSEKIMANIAVLNEGIGGNCVLHGGLGPTALARIDRDVFAQGNVRWLIVLEGVNDIGGSHDPSVATNLIAAFERMIDQAHAKHIRVYGVTILPFGRSFYSSPEHETARQLVNHWIRTSNKFDAVIDFDLVMRDSQDSTCLLPMADSGDHLHPNETGYQMMADTIGLDLFAR